jgi:AmiR/NasT family two-component response regulator
VALANAHLYDSTATLARHMQTAMESRAVIEQAKGIVMGERRCTAEEAFAVLVKVSQDSNRKLRDVAAALVERAANQHDQ